MYSPRLYLFLSLIPLTVLAGSLPEENPEEWEEWSESNPIVYADEEQELEEDSPSDPVQMPSDDSSFIQGQISARSRQAGGIGYNTGYSTLQGFFGLKDRKSVV